MKKTLLVLVLILGTLVGNGQINPDLRNKVLELIKGKHILIIGYDLDGYTITNLDIKPITEGQFILDNIEVLKNSEDNNSLEMKKKIEQLELNYKYMPSYKKDILKYYKVILDILGEPRKVIKNPKQLNRRFIFTFDPAHDTLDKLYY